MRTYAVLALLACAAAQAVAWGDPPAPLAPPSPSPAPPAGPAVPEWAKVSKEQVAEADRLKVPVAIEDERTKVRFVLIPGGTFTMGSPDTEKEGEQTAFAGDEGPQHQVTLSTFYLSINEVTNEQFERFVTEASHQTTAEKKGKGLVFNPRSSEWEETARVNWRRPLFGGQRQSNWPQHPVVHVSWADADAYRKWAQSDLPTEAQFEYALRGGPGGTAAYPWGATPAPPVRYGNYGGQETKAAFGSWPRPLIDGYDDGYAGTAPVGSFGANPFGLFDISGNVWEWCQDVWISDFYGRTAATQRDPVATGSAADPRVIRGGCWGGTSPNLRSAHRGSHDPVGGDDFVGFRLARPGPAPLPSWAKVSAAQVAEAERLKVPVAIEDDKSRVRFVLIPGGTFTMGSPDTEKEGEQTAFAGDEGPQHQVTLSTFYLSINEVTNEQFERFVTATRYRTTAEKEGTGQAFNPEKASTEEVTGVSWRQPLFGSKKQADWPRYPVVLVSWTDADAYRKWAKSDLPTEAQFEWALRGGASRTKYPWGDGDTPPTTHGNYAGDEAKRAFPKWSWPLILGYDDGYAGAAPVGCFEANPFGLYDISGNVGEWCQDVYLSDFYARKAATKRDPLATGAATDMRVVRWSSWRCASTHLRSARRGMYFPVVRDDTVGFRVARPVLAR